MPIFNLSRYQFTLAKTNTAGQRVLTDRVPFRYTSLPDTRLHTVQGGDTMENLAQRYFARLETRDMPAAGLAWIIRDFQPIPIIDPTLRLKEGTVVYIPSEDVVRTRIFDERRRALP